MGLGKNTVEEVSLNMYCIPSAEENIIMEMPQKIPIYTFSATLGHNGISILIFFKAPVLECIISGTWSSDIFFGTSSTYVLFQKSLFGLFIGSWSSYSCMDVGLI